MDPRRRLPAPGASGSTSTRPGEIIEHVFDSRASESCRGGIRRLAAVPAPEDVERAALIALLRERPDGLTWSQIAAEAGQVGSALALWQALRPADLFRGEDVVPEPVTAAARDLRAWQASGLTILTVLDDEYPPSLREIHEIPPVLFYRGSLRAGEVAISVVGSRAATRRGLDIARNVAAGLVQRDLAVVSGLARGIDSAAHNAVLEAAGRTVAVLGCGMNHYYPAENRVLQDRIAAAGMVVSQFWPDAAPRQQQFPMRNAVMSGYARATIVVEAGEKSGARIQARQAVAHGRPVILTDLVVNSTEWGRRLVDRPGVFVACSTTEVMSQVQEIVTADAEIDKMLAAERG